MAKIEIHVIKKPTFLIAGFMPEHYNIPKIKKKSILYPQPPIYSH